MGHMKKQQLKIGIFAATITVLLISMGNLPIATAGTAVPTATMTVDLFCDLKVDSSNLEIGNVNPNDVKAFDFSLINDGNGLSTAEITGAEWKTGGDASLIAVGDTTYGVTDNSITVVSFTGAAQPLGTFAAGETAETVALSVTVNLIIANFQGAATLVMTVADNCT